MPYENFLSEVGEGDEKYETFSLDCKGATGDMIYISDREVTHSSYAGGLGHSICEVNVLKYTKITHSGMPLALETS